MPNAIKYSTTGDTLSLKKGNIFFGVGDVGKGPSSATTYYNGVTPSAGGYTIYSYNASQTSKLSFHTAVNDSALITYTNGVSGQNFSTATQCLNWYVTQSNYVCVNRDYEGIVTNGLVLNLDAGFTPSYTSSGTTWYDLSYGGNNGTLTNGPTFNSSDGGSIVFDGSDDYCPFYAPNLGTTTTVEMWTKCISLGGKMFFGWSVYDVWTQGNAVGYNTGNGDVYGISSAQVSSLGIVGNWKHLVFEMRSDVSYTNNKIYVNGVNQTLSQQYSSENANSRNFNSGYGTICGWLASSGYYMNQQVSSFRVYNRALTQSEITQNYNAQKSRFGL